MQRTVEPLPPGDDGTMLTLERMASTVQARAGHPSIRAVGEHIARQVLPRDVPAQVRELRRYLSEHVNFVHDPLGVEWVGDPARMVDDIAKRYRIMGDCDDVAVLGATIAASIGITPRFVVLGFHDPGAAMAHVYTEVFDGRQWVDLDTTRNIPETQRVRMTSRKWIVPIYPS